MSFDDGGSVSASEIEFQKENVLPLKGGRDPALLKKSLFSERAKHEIFQQQQQQYLSRIQAARDGGDSDAHMESWSEYIAWARQSLMNGGRKNEYAVILNDCVNECKEYRDDYRFLKVCSEFVDYCDKPFAFLGWMESNHIGQCYSLFWETKARLLEDCSHDTAAADKAFEDGIRFNAQPMNRLKEKRKELHARVANRMNRGESEEGPTDVPAAAGRRALGALGHSAGTSRVAQDGPGQLKSEFRPSNARPSLQVFASDDTRGDKEQWISYGSEREAIKENKDMARQWTRVKMPQTPNYVKKPQFEIFDETDEADEQNAAPANLPPPVRRAVGLDLEAAATVAPEKIRGAVPPQLVEAQVPRSAKAIVSAAPDASPITKKKVRAGFDEQALKGESLSFEELRAMRWFAAKRADEEKRLRQKREAEEEAEELRRVHEDLNRALRDEKGKKMFSRAATEVSFMIDHNSTLDTMNYEALVRGSAKTTNLDAIDDLRNVYADTIDLENHLAGPRGSTKMIREPTFNTLAVMNEVEQMFNDELAFSDHSAQLAERSMDRKELPASRIAAPPVPARKAAAFEIFEDEDSLESFRASMNASAIAASSSSHHVSVPSVSQPKVQKLEIFCDESVEMQEAPKPVVAAVSGKSFPPTKPASDIVNMEESGNTPSVVDNPWQRLESEKLQKKLASTKGFFDHPGAEPGYEDDGKYLELGEAVYDLSTQIGGGAISSVYRAEDVVGDDGTCAIKVCKPAHSWEFHIMSQLRKRCPNSVALRHFPNPKALHVFSSESVLLMDFNENGTLERMMDVWCRLGDGLPLVLAAFYAAEAIRVVELLHGMRLLHNDITPENVMLSVNQDDVVDDQSLQLVDFSCSLDLSDFLRPTYFRGSGRCTVPCPEMTRGETWCFQQDYFGLANLVHSLLFAGATLELVRSPRGNRWEPAKKSPSAMWDSVLLGLLNPPENFSSTQFRESADMLRKVRAPLDEFVKTSQDDIRKALAKQNILMFEGK